MPSAIVTGATGSSPAKSQNSSASGILGREIVGALGKDSETWQTVQALSRSQKESYPPNVKHDFIDLTGDAKSMAKQLQGIQVDYVFFAAYLQKDTEQENWDVNGKTRIKITGTMNKLKRVILTTGAKQYGVHLGPPKQPMEESDPWIEGPAEDFGRQSKRRSMDWVVTYPNDVIGVAKGNFMNLATSIGIYAAISKEIDGQLVFPGSETFYTCFDCFTYSRLHAQLNLWAAMEPRCSSQAFNVINGDTESWQNLWPKMAKRFGCKVPANQFDLPVEKGTGSIMDLAPEPPTAETAAERGLQGKVAPGKVEQRINLIKWSQRPDVKKAWERLAAREGLEKDGLEKATWGFLGFVLGRNYNIVQSMSKARRLGWNGYIDTWDSL
ncbi:MAG: hypothetical protein Q9180_007535, partial [Flavoplaca navasiana]